MASFSRTARRLMTLPAVLVLVACIGTPEGVEPVEDFDAERYLGRWYELARLDHRFERDLVSVTATYRRRDDGAVEVINRGYDVEDGRWKEVEGVARFVEGPRTGHLKVSFFGPFYGSYVVFELERPGYEYAFVSGFNRDYLWLLSRSRTLDDGLRERFVETASELGFPVDELIWVDQETDYRDD